MTSQWGITPRQSIAIECANHGKAPLVDACIALMGGEDVDFRLIGVLAGPDAAGWVADTGETNRYWLRVWGARGLLWAWDDRATDAIHAGLADPAWRVREMSAKVIAKHAVGDLLEAVAELRQDPILRVRAAADRAVTLLTAAGA